MKMLSKKAPNLKLLPEILKIQPKKESIWQEALTHKSWLFYHPEANLPHNERLEFLGDAVLELIVSEYLFQKYPDFSEGELTFLRASLVNRERLGKIGQKLGLSKILLFHPRIKGKGRLTVFGDALEAIIGALYLDLGFEQAKIFVTKNILTGVEKLVQEKSYKDPKTSLQEELQKNFGILPEYKLIKEEGKEHEKIFHVEVYLNGQKIGYGVGRSKQKAEFEAALDALKHKRWLKQD